MENIKLRIGTKFGTEHYQIEVPATIPSTWAEVQAMNIPEDVKTACFNRAWRIRLQEDSGARDMLAELSADDRRPDNMAAVVEAAAEIVAAYIADPTAKKAGRPRRPQEVVIPEGAMSKKALEEMSKALAAQGIKVTIK